MKNVLIICGGKSAEHEISLRSAKTILAHMDRQRIHPIIAVIGRSGSWYQLEDAQSLIDILECTEPLPYGALCTLFRKHTRTYLLTEAGIQTAIDMAFPIVHGPMGEDGTLQGFLEMMDLPYAGCGVLASAMGMDKATFKNSLSALNLPVTPYTVLKRTALDTNISFEHLCKELRTQTLFIKPSLMGSAIGVSKVRTDAQLKVALDEAFTYDHTVLVEAAVVGRELECSVMGNGHPKASLVGEIKFTHEFYTYAAKYLDESGAEIILPAKLSDSIVAQIQDLAIRTYTAINGVGFARVDFFLSEDNALFINEINTAPGFTSISMYPKLWELEGIQVSELIARLLDLAQEVYDQKQALCLSPRDLIAS